jgi:hypothetical protein
MILWVPKGICFRLILHLKEKHFSIFPVWGCSPWGFPRIFPSIFSLEAMRSFLGWYWTLMVKSPFKKFNLWLDTPPTHSSIHPSIHSSCPTNCNQGVFFLVQNINKISWIYIRNIEISQIFFFSKNNCWKNIIACKLAFPLNKYLNKLLKTWFPMYPITNFRIGIIIKV